MKIVKVTGGLGNQMFQYAFYKSLKNKDSNVKLDISVFKSYNAHNGYELNRVFGIEEDFSSLEDVERLGDCKTHFLSKVRRRIFGLKNSHYIQKKFEYDPEVFKFDNIYLDGYWQSEKFFEDIKDDVIRDFAFVEELSEKNIEIKTIAESENSISIHIRRGDYVTDTKANKVHGNICDLDYYEKAINFLIGKINSPIFIVFSDDIEWAKSNLKLNNCHFVSWNKGNHSYNDMRLMSYCKHNIIANSSFSWWGAYLNKNPNKIVVAPNKWFNDTSLNTINLIPNNWHQISG
ncbi:MAG: alpha-1,2-fucosyltransferase [Eubacteriales bacterium]|nr:alpha-1,2-fucosyltransferase [Eubacteriales bacterium]